MAHKKTAIKQRRYNNLKQVHNYKAVFQVISIITMLNTHTHNSLKFKCNSILFKLLLETPKDPWIVMITSLDD